MVLVVFDEGQITHLICARLKYDLYDFLGGVFGPFLQEKEQEAGPKHPLQKSYRSYFRRAQIRWVLWPSSRFPVWKTNHPLPKKKTFQHSETLPGIWHTKQEQQCAELLSGPIKSEAGRIPLIFLSLLFWKKEGNPPQKARIFLLCRTPKILGKEGKTLKKARKFLATKKARKSKKARKGRSGTVSESTVSNTELSEFFGAHWAPGSELSEFLSASYLCAKSDRVFSQNSPSLPQNSVSSLLRNSALETVFRPFPTYGAILRYCRHDTPLYYLRDTFQGRLALPQNGAIPRLGT